MTRPQNPIMIVLGTRPEIIKLSPVVREFEDRDWPYTLVHTGQHYSDSLDGVFFDQLAISEPDHHLGVGSRPHGHQTGEMMIRLEPLVHSVDPSFLLVQGDTNSALAGSLVAAKADVPQGHVEAGLRSDDRRMPEEVNRVLIDHAAEVLFPPTDEARARLAREDLDQRCFVTGNTIVDAVRQNELVAAEKSAMLDELGLTPGEYVLFTAHREENVDAADRFADILTGVAEFAERTGLECIYPVHPRAREQLVSKNLTVPDPVTLVDPLDYLDFLALESDAAIVFTDSGGVQEETCILQVPCVTVRENTERPESVEVGANVVAGTSPGGIVAAGRAQLEATPEWPCPFGDGNAAERIVDAIAEYLLEGPRREESPQERTV
ncbi:non-hydrolyzing UDP-N-acetylglucosamine 2-epimerase [Halorubrum sp. DTA98]|uniref:non-hydrolyzing UDP-N-acetylglucosamine 2-epimerase n=1 Tax=Halorubrum sp. DTA98 TaxID=3402163 RepID=UPI003AAF0137